jgi:hypothetical protein
MMSISVSKQDTFVEGVWGQVTHFRAVLLSLLAAPHISSSAMTRVRRRQNIIF